MLGVVERIGARGVIRTLDLLVAFTLSIRVDAVFGINNLAGCRFVPSICVQRCGFRSGSLNRVWPSSFPGFVSPKFSGSFRQERSRPIRSGDPTRLRIPLMSGSLRSEISVSDTSPARLKSLPAGSVRRPF